MPEIASDSGQPPSKTAMILTAKCPTCECMLEFESYRLGLASPCPDCENDVPLIGAAQTRHFPTSAYGFISLCRNLMADGELSGEEVWELANWLNNHPDAAREWPGSIFVEPLQRAFEGGEITGSGLFEIAELLTRIETEWCAAISGPSKSAGRNRPVPHTVAPQVLRKVELPFSPLVLSVRSRSGRGYYQVDLSNQSCDCPDWESKRQAFALGSPSRCCKHMAEAFLEAHRKGHVAFDGPMLEILSLEAGLSISPEWHALQIGKRLVFVAHGSGEWINVYAPREGAYTRFGYNSLQERWAYGVRPHKSREILESIDALLS